MFSGKSSELFRRLNVYLQQPKFKVRLFKWSFDTRYADQDQASTHKNSFGHQIQAEAIPCGDPSLREVEELLWEADVIGIDEAQFFAGSGPLLERLVLAGKVVILALLNSTFKQRPWPNSPREYLAAYAQTTTLSAVCDICKESAHACCSWKKSEGNGQLMEIGGSELYGAACIPCIAKLREERAIAKEQRRRVRIRQEYDLLEESDEAEAAPEAPTLHAMPSAELEGFGVFGGGILSPEQMRDAYTLSKAGLGLVIPLEPESRSDQDSESTEDEEARDIDQETLFVERAKNGPFPHPDLFTSELADLDAEARQHVLSLGDEAVALGILDNPAQLFPFVMQNLRRFERTSESKADYKTTREQTPE